MKTLFLILTLYSTITLAQQPEKVLVQLQSDKVCINSDTCIFIRAHISLTSKHFYVVDIEGNKLETDIRLIDRQSDGYFLYATNEDLSAYILITHTKISVDYNYDGQRYLLDYHIKEQDGKQLIQFY